MTTELCDSCGQPQDALIHKDRERVSEHWFNDTEPAMDDPGRIESEPQISGAWPLPRKEANRQETRERIRRILDTDRWPSGLRLTPQDRLMLEANAKREGLW